MIFVEYNSKEILFREIQVKSNRMFQNQSELIVVICDFKIFR